MRKIRLTNLVNRIMLIIYRSEVERRDKNRINVNCLLAFNKYNPELIRDFWLILYFLKVILPAVILKRFHFMASTEQVISCYFIETKLKRQAKKPIEKRLFP